EIMAAILIWDKTRSSHIELLVDFILRFLICFCPGLSEDAYPELMNGILDLAGHSDHNGHYDQFIGQKRIGFTIEDEGFMLTIDPDESYGELPIILREFPQQGIPREFSQLFTQIIVKKQIRPGIFEYVGVSGENLVLTVIGTKQEIMTASLVWPRPFPPDSIKLLYDFGGFFFASFCPE